MRRLFIAVLMIFSFVTVALAVLAHGARMATVPKRSPQNTKRRIAPHTSRGMSGRSNCSGSDGLLLRMLWHGLLVRGLTSPEMRFSLPRRVGTTGDDEPRRSQPRTE